MTTARYHSCINQIWRLGDPLVFSLATSSVLARERGNNTVITYSSTHPTPTQLTTPPVALDFSKVLLPPSLKTT